MTPNHKQTHLWGIYMPEYRPIDTAPKDGTVIVVNLREDPHKELRVRWTKTNDAEGWDIGPMFYPYKWRPLEENER